MMTKEHLKKDKEAMEQAGLKALTVGDVVCVCCIVLLITLILKLPYFIMQDFCNIN